MFLVRFVIADRKFENSKKSFMLHSLSIILLFWWLFQKMVTFLCLYLLSCNTFLSNNYPSTNDQWRQRSEEQDEQKSGVCTEQVRLKTWRVTRSANACISASRIVALTPPKTLNSFHCVYVHQVCRWMGGGWGAVERGRKVDEMQKSAK